MSSFTGFYKVSEDEVQIRVRGVPQVVLSSDAETGEVVTPTGDSVDAIVQAAVDATLAAIGSGDSVVVATYSPGSFALATEQYSTMVAHLKLAGTERVTLAGTSRLRIT